MLIINTLRGLRTNSDIFGRIRTYSDGFGGLLVF